MDEKDCLESLDKTGEAEVRKTLAGGRYPPTKTALIQEWLKTKEQERDYQVQQRQETRDEEALQIAREANEISHKSNEISHKSNRISFGSFIVSALSFILAVLALIISLYGRKS